MKRLTSQRCSGIKTGYWSPAKKDELIQRLGKYEDTGLEPGEIKPVVHAHWESILESEYVDGEYLVPKKRCSHCKETNKNYAPPYCPHCGAVMDEEVPHGTD